MEANTNNYHKNPTSAPNLKTSRNGIPVLVPENIKMCSHAPTSTPPSYSGIFNSNAINAIYNNHTHFYPTHFSLAQKQAQAQAHVLAQAKAQAQAQIQAAKYYSTPIFRPPCRCGRNHSLGLIPCLDQNAYVSILKQNVWKPYWGGYGYVPAFGGSAGGSGGGFGRGRG